MIESTNQPETPLIHLWKSMKCILRTYVHTVWLFIKQLKSGFVTKSSRYE